MNIPYYFRILIVICYLSTAYSSNATDKALLEDCLKALKIEDVANRTTKYWTSRNELERLNKNKENEDYILSLFESSDVSEMGRTVVYKAILNSRRLTRDDLPFIVELFKAVYERIDWKEDSIRSSRWFVTEEQALLELSMIIYTLQGIPRRTVYEERKLLIENPDVWLDIALNKSQTALDTTIHELEVENGSENFEPKLNRNSEEGNLKNNNLLEKNPTGQP